MTETPKVKTWSRETAWAMMLGCFFLAGSGQPEVLEIVIWPTTIFTLAAFGFRQPVVNDWMRTRQERTY